MNKTLSYTCYLILLLSLFACKVQDNAKRKALKINKTEYLFEKLALNEFDFEQLSLKASVQVTQDEKTRPFNANVRIRKDSAIWVSITPILGIEVARILITKDTVKVINRFDKNYFIGDYAYINKRFDIELEFDLIQSMLIGNPIDFEEDEKVKLAIDKEKYYLGNLKKRKAKKVDNKPQKIERQKEEVISLWVDQYSFKVSNFIFSDLLANRFLIGEYSDFKSIDNQLIANDLKFIFQSEKPAEVTLQYSKVSLEGPLKFSFNISSKYEQVYY